MSTAATRTERAAVVALLRSVDDLDERQFEQIYRHYHEQLCRFAISRGAVDPEGVVNMALFDAYQAFGRQPIRDEPAFRRYLYRAVTSRVIGEHRRRRPVPQDVPDHALITDDWSDELIERQWLAQVVEELPDAQRAVIQDRFYADLTVTESAERLGRNNGAVHQLQYRAVRRLRRLLLGGAAVVLVIAAFALWRSSVEERSTIDTGPAEAPAPSPAPATPDVQTGSTTVSDGDAAPGPGPVLQVETDDATPATTTPSAEDQSATGLEGTDPAETPVSSTTSVAAAPVGAPPKPDPGSGEAPSPGTKPVDLGLDTDPELLGLAAPATPANTCHFWFDAKGSFWLTLFDPKGDAAAAEAYQPPVKVRVTDANGTVAIVDFATPAPAGELAPRRTGWIAIDELGVPQPTYPAGSGDVWAAKFWDFPIDAIVTATYLDLLDTGEAVWAAAPACTGGHVLDGGSLD